MCRVRPGKRRNRGCPQHEERQREKARALLLTNMFSHFSLLSGSAFKENPSLFACSNDVKPPPPSRAAAVMILRSGRRTSRAPTRVGRRTSPSALHAAYIHRRPRAGKMREKYRSSTDYWCQTPHPPRTHCYSISSVRSRCVCGQFLQDRGSSDDRGGRAEVYFSGTRTNNHDDNTVYDDYDDNENNVSIRVYCVCCSWLSSTHFLFYFALALPRSSVSSHTLNHQAVSRTKALIAKLPL